MFRELRRYRREGFPQFSLRYFGKWEMVKLRRYVNWQLSGEEYRLSFLRACVDEYKALGDVLTNPMYLSQPPALIMDFGCGIGRSSIFFMHMLHWDSTKFLLVDGHRDVYGKKENMTAGQTGFHYDVGRLSDSFYTNFDLLDRFLVANGVQSFDLIDLTKERRRVAEIRGVDLFYSFHSVGYHYDIVSVLDHYGLHNVMRQGGLLIFGLRRQTDPLRKELHTALLLERGYEKVNEIQGSRVQDFLVLRRVRSL